MIGDSGLFSSSSSGRIVGEGKASKASPRTKAPSPSKYNALAVPSLLMREAGEGTTVNGNGLFSNRFA